MSSHTAMQQAETISRGGVTIVREPAIVPRVVCVDGMPGCGKTLLSAIVAALDRVELEKYNYPLEYTLTLDFLGRISRDATVALVRLLTDLDLYDLMSARETNFRPSDLSSVFKHPHPWRYLRRLFLADGEASVQRIAHERPILNLVTHNLLPISGAFAEALERRWCIIEVVRHPLYMLKQWFLYIRRYGTDARDFTIWIDADGQAVPWFAQGWESRFLASNPMDRVIYSIERLGTLADEALARLPQAAHQQVCIVPFERFVLDPWPYLRELERLLDTRVTSMTRREMKRQRVPRRRIAEGIALKVYKDNGWQPPANDATESDELRRRRAWAGEHATPDAMAVLDRLCREYEVRYGPMEPAA